MANLKDCRFDGNLLISCKMDGVEVSFLDPEWSVDDAWKVASRVGGGAAIVTAFFPAAGVVGALVGVASILKDKGEGYYDVKKRKIHDGRIYRRNVSDSGYLIT